MFLQLQSQNRRLHQTQLSYPNNPVRHTAVRGNTLFVRCFFYFRLTLGSCCTRRGPTLGRQVMPAVSASACVCRHKKYKPSMGIRDSFCWSQIWVIMTQECKHFGLSEISCSYTLITNAWHFRSNWVKKITRHGLNALVKHEIGGFQWQMSSPDSLSLEVVKMSGLLSGLHYKGFQTCPSQNGQHWRRQWIVFLIGLNLFYFMGLRRAWPAHILVCPGHVMQSQMRRESDALGLEL